MENELPEIVPLTSESPSPIPKPQFDLWLARTAIVEQNSALEPSDVKRYLSTLESLAQGDYHSNIIKSGGLTIPELDSIAEQHPALRKLNNIARKRGEIYRQLKREEEMDHRAIEGLEEPIFNSQGEQVGTRRKPSDQLLMFGLKANNRAKYGEIQSTQSTGVILQVNMGFDRKALKQELQERDATIETTASDSSSEAL